MKDKLVLALLLASFATLLSTHVVIAIRLIWRTRPRYRGLLALLVPPLAPVWAFGQQWRRLCWLWVASLVAYAILLGVASI